MGEIGEADYGALVEELMGFLDGDTGPVTARLEEEMAAASDALEFELAARLRALLQPTPPRLVAALAPRLRALAGTLADGTTTWMTGPETVRSHIVPRSTEAAAGAGKPAPRVVVALPVCVTDAPEAARERASRLFAIYGGLPSYRAMPDRQKADRPAHLALVGDQDRVPERHAPAHAARATGLAWERGAAGPPA